MDRRMPDASHESTHRIDLELRIADDVIALLAHGEATRAIVGGLRFGDALLPEVRRHALGTGVTVDALPCVDEGLADLLFQRSVDA